MKYIVLVGNPNTGKSTFFNSVANAEEHVGNWHGVTTDYKEKRIKFDGHEIVITDLPGTYSLSPFSFEESVTKEYLLSHKDCEVINIIDGNNLERNLLLTFELVEMGIRPIVCVNMANEFVKNGLKIDKEKFEKELGLKCFFINAQNKKESKEVLNYAVKNTNDKKEKNETNKIDTYSHIDIFSYITDLQDMFSDYLPKYNQNFNLSIFEKIKILEQDESVISKLKITDKEKNDIINILEKNNTLEKVINLRFSIIKKFLSNCVSKDSNKIYGYSKIDKYCLNKWLCFPIFFVIIAGLFFFTFGSFGTMLSGTLSNFAELMLSPLSSFAQNKISNQFVADFISNAFCGSVVSLFSFLPQVILMFLGLYILEDSGYMSRVAFIFEDFLKKLGLSGKSIFALLMSFGCSTTATLSSRNLENKNSKIKTAMLTPYISCTAKLPLYLIICNAFFPKFKVLIIIFLYVLGVVVALCVSYFLNKTILKSNETTFVMELPKYRIPNFKKISKNVYYNAKQFLLRAGSVLLGFSCIVWILQNCNFRFQYHVGESMLETLSNFLSPIFSPLGFGTAGAVSAILCGFVAKEIIVSTIGIINGLDGTGGLNQISNSLLLSTSAFCLTASSSLSFLVFALLYLPCISTVSVMIKEIGRKWTLFACLLQFAISYALSFVVYKIANYFIFNGVLSGIVSIIVFTLICVLIFFIFGIIKHKRYCKFCPANKNCDKKQHL